MTTRRQFIRGTLASLGALGASAVPGVSLAQGSDYPNRPIRIIVPYAAGGGPDVLTRKMAVKLTEALGGTAVVVDNVVGAGGILAAQNAARATPDGLICFALSRSVAPCS